MYVILSIRDLDLNRYPAPTPLILLSVDLSWLEARKPKREATGRQVGSVDGRFTFHTRSRFVNFKIHFLFSFILLRLPLQPQYHYLSLLYAFTCSLPSPFANANILLLSLLFGFFLISQTFTTFRQLQSKLRLVLPISS